MSEEKLVYEQIYETPPYVKAQVTESQGRLALELDYYDADSTQHMILPRCTGGLEELPQRNLNVQWAEGEGSLETYLFLLEGLSTYINLRFPGWCVMTPAKIYEQLPHGLSAPSVWEYIMVAGRFQEIEADVTKKLREGSWSGGFSDVVFISPEPGYSLFPNELPEIPWNVPKAMFVPMFDFDVYSSGDSPQNDLSKATNILAENGFSGWIIRSGDSKNGGYHFVSDLLLPHDQNYWQVRGRLLNLLTPDGDQYDRLHKFANELENATSDTDARRVARQILDQQEGVPSDSVTGSFVDFRWMAHSIEQGVGVLRALQSKGYATPPTVVGEIK